jgi:predicted GH43/DUF377 family glycosyl hydrolase
MFVSMKIVCFTFTAFSLITFSHAEIVYKVVAQRLSNSPILSKSTGSNWDFNYNAAVYTYQNEINLIVRSQNLKNSSIPFEVGPSYLTSSKISFNNSGFPSATPTNDVIFVPDNSTEACGTEDPRMTDIGNAHYMLYTAYNCSNAMLSAAMNVNPNNPTGWTRRGFIFPAKSWSKSGAMLLATPYNALQQ